MRGPAAAGVQTVGHHSQNSQLWSLLQGAMIRWLFQGRASYQVVASVQPLQYIALLYSRCPMPTGGVSGSALAPTRRSLSCQMVTAPHHQLPSTHSSYRILESLRAAAPHASSAAAQAACLHHPQRSSSSTTTTAWASADSTVSCLASQAAGL